VVNSARPFPGAIAGCSALLVGQANEYLVDGDAPRLADRGILED
jgi:hypothetical protein